MLDQHFLSVPVVAGPALMSPPALPDAVSPPAGSDVFGPLQGGERVAWRGRCAVAEYAFDEPASPPRWTLPENTAVLVTDRRIRYAHTPSGFPTDAEVVSGELRWLWPQHLRVQPGSRTPGRSTSAPQIQLVCASADGSFPALVFAGGDLATIGDADRLANMLRHAIARFRVDNADKLGLSVPQSRMLSRLLIGPEFSNYQGGEGQTVTLLGALPVSRPAPAPAEPDPALADLAAEPRFTPEPRLTAEPQFTAEPRPAVSEATRRIPISVSEPTRRLTVSTSEPTRRLTAYRPGLAADEARATQAAAAEEATQLAQPDLASRVAELAARVAGLVSESESPVMAATPPPADAPTIDLTARAESVRRAAARFAANSARGKAGARRPDREIGPRGNRLR